MSALMKGMGAEYSDEVTKSNKKEDMMLTRKLRQVVNICVDKKIKCNASKVTAMIHKQ